jgi:hypothetical protein
VTLLGPDIPYRDAGWLSATGGLVTVDVPASVRQAVKDHPLALIRNGPSPTVFLRETAGGWLVGADVGNWRIEAGDDAVADVHVTRYGAPQEGEQLDARLAPYLPTPSGPETGTPTGAVRVTPPEPTDAQGRTELRVGTDDPVLPGTTRPRPGIDGQIYVVVVDRGGSGPRASVVARVFDRFVAPESPKWKDVREILGEYAQLYPVMTRRMMDLGRYRDVTTYRDTIRMALELDIADPNHMPVTRDLSRPKRDMILAWLALPDLPGGGDGDTPVPSAVPASGVFPDIAPVDPLAAKRSPATGPGDGGQQ